MKRRPGRTGGIVSCAQLALLPAAAFGVHQLRYLLAFGGNAQVVLRETGHNYLHSFLPWIVLLLAALVGGFLRLLGRALAGHDTPGRYAVSLLGLWLACFGCLMAIFVGQELLEGLYATGHPAGLAGVFGYGGWWSVPAAATIGLVLAALLHGALWALRAAGRHAARSRRPVGATPPPRLHPRILPSLRLAPLADGRSGRGPPV